MVQNSRIPILGTFAAIMAGSLLQPAVFAASFQASHAIEQKQFEFRAQACLQHFLEGRL
jgi:hypothetical protein